MPGSQSFIEYSQIPEYDSLALTMKHTIPILGQGGGIAHQGFPGVHNGQSVMYFWLI